MPASASYGLDIRRFLPGGDRTRPALDAAKISAQFEDLMGSLPSPPPAPAVSRASTVGVDGGRISGDEGSESRPQKKQGARERRAQRRAQRRQQRVARHAATTAMGRPGITDAPPAFTARQHVRAVQEQFDAQLNHVGSRTAGGEGAEERGRRQGNVPASTGSQPPENMPIMRAIVTKQFERPDELVRAIEASLPASAELAQCRRRRERELEEEEEMDSALGGFIVDGDDEQPRSGRRATLIKRGDGYHSGSDDGYDSSSSSSSDDSGSSMSSSDQESAKSDVDADECETEQQEEGKDQEKQAGLHNQQHEDGSEDEAEAELEVERPLIQERLAAVIAAAPPTPSRVVQQLQAAEEERKNRQREESESASESEQAVKGDAADESDTEAAIPSQRRRRPVRQQRRVMRVVRRARLRASAERESTGVGQVEVGELVAVLGSAISSDGVERVVCNDAPCRAANTHTCVHAALLAHTRPGLCGAAHTTWMGQRGVGTRKRPARRGRCGPEAGLGCGRPRPRRGPGRGTCADEHTLQRRYLEKEATPACTDGSGGGLHAGLGLGGCRGCAGNGGTGHVGGQRGRVGCSAASQAPAGMCSGLSFVRERPIRPRQNAVDAGQER
eukprot:COSAG01_NODE_5285_length_4356_cov_44.815833_4_plen_617_part_00